MNTDAQYQCRSFLRASSWRSGGNDLAWQRSASKTGRMDTYGKNEVAMAPNSCGCRRTFNGILKCADRACPVFIKILDRWNQNFLPSSNHLNLERASPDRGAESTGTWGSNNPGEECSSLAGCRRSSSPSQYPPSGSRRCATCVSAVSLSA